MKVAVGRLPIPFVLEEEAGDDASLAALELVLAEEAGDDASLAALDAPSRGLVVASPTRLLMLISLASAASAS
jgi:hypothetical protein